MMFSPFLLIPRTVWRHGGERVGSCVGGGTYTSVLQWPCVYLGMYDFRSGGLVASLDPQLGSRFGLFLAGIPWFVRYRAG